MYAYAVKQRVNAYAGLVVDFNEVPNPTDSDRPFMIAVFDDGTEMFIAHPARWTGYPAGSFETVTDKKGNESQKPVELTCWWTTAVRNGQTVNQFHVLPGIHELDELEVIDL